MVQCLVSHRMASSLSIVKRTLKVALVGDPNAGKSTLLNRLIGSDVSSVSKKVHTTRKNILGVYTDFDTQLVFCDSPGMISREHMLKHRLEDSLYNDPKNACETCDIIAVVLDVSNPRSRNRLNKGIIDLLNAHQGSSRSMLIMNKVDLVKEKRVLLDISTRLTQGCLEGKLTMSSRDIMRLPRERIQELNLTSHLAARRSISEIKQETNAPILKRRFVIELESSKREENRKRDDDDDDPDSISYKDFSEVFSISALKDDGVDQLRDKLISLAHPVDEWPHSPDYLTDLTSTQIVESIIRGRILDHVKGAIPYLVKLNFQQLSYDELGSLHIILTIKCPQNYMVSEVVGKSGVTIWNITNESRDLISRNLGCDVKLDVRVEGLQRRIQ